MDGWYGAQGGTAACCHMKEYKEYIETMEQISFDFGVLEDRREVWRTRYVTREARASSFDAL